MNKIYKNYRYDIFPKVKHRLGATRIAFILEYIVQNSLEKISEQPNRIGDLDWDNLFILDACRADVYEEVAGKKVQTRITAESNSAGFIRENFSTGDWNDTVLITANPHYNEEIFEELTGRKPDEVFEAVFHTYQTNWNTESNTVLPSSLIQNALTAEKLWPEKRKLVHFMQPHYPFIKADDLTDGGINADLDHSTEGESVWEKAEQGIYDNGRLWNAYAENLEYVLPFVEELADSLSGRSVVSADHGNMVGENNLYGHPGGSKAKVLREVPWDVVN